MRNYTCLLIDDEPLARMMVLEYLQAFSNIQVLAECNDGFEGMKAIATHQPDFIFLDIQMPKINGFELLELLEQPPAVIFTTAFDEYAMKAFEANAIDYLLKPFSKDRFEKAVTKVLHQLGSSQQSQALTAATEAYLDKQEDLSRIVVKHNHVVRILSLQEITYLEAYGDYIKIHTSDGVFLKKKTMSFFESHLNDKDFIRVHRSYIIPTKEIVKIDPPDFVILKEGAKIPISKTGYAKLKQVLGM
jgi:two-component system, LytTR family, response regulator